MEFLSSMTIQRKFILFFLCFTFFVTLILGGVALLYIKGSINLFVTAPNKELALIVADRLYLRSVISFVSISLVGTSLSLGIGYLVFQKISKDFLRRVSELTGLAEIRVGKAKEKGESGLLKEYIELLLEDQKRLSHYEKVIAWKDGARLLIHEVKNPLTPLKLSLQNLSLLSNSDYETEEINSALTSIVDIENILKSFKELVNIEYGEIKEIEFISFWTDFEKQLRYSFPTLTIINKINDKTLFLDSEKNLLKMVFINLIKNGVEANKDGFELILEKKNSHIIVSAITKDIIISDINGVFQFGVSEKGDKRGYGLFLCMKISEYLNLNLEAKNFKDRVIFTFTIRC